MGSDISFVAMDGHARVTLAGVRAPANLLTAASRTAAECGVREIHRVLIDVRGMLGALDTLETYEVAVHDLPGRDGVRVPARAAIVDRREDVARARCSETVAVNRGLDLRLFDDEARAMRWLTAG